MNETRDELREIAMDGSKSSYQRRRAAEDLFKDPTQRNDPEMIHMLLADGDRSLRGDVVRTMIRLDDPTFHPFIAKALEDPDDYVKRDAMRGLATCADPNIAGCILKLTESDNLSLRSDAKRAYDLIQKAIDSLPTPTQKQKPDPEPEPVVEIGTTVEAVKDVETGKDVEIESTTEPTPVKPLVVEAKREIPPEPKAEPAYFAQSNEPPPIPKSEPETKKRAREKPATSNERTSPQPPPVPKNHPRDDDDECQPDAEMSLDEFERAAQRYSDAQGESSGCQAKSCGCIFIFLVALVIVFMMITLFLKAV